MATLVTHAYLDHSMARLFLQIENEITCQGPGTVTESYKDTHAEEHASAEQRKCEAEPSRFVSRQRNIDLKRGITTARPSHQTAEVNTTSICETCAPSWQHC